MKQLLLRSNLNFYSFSAETEQASDLLSCI
nr:MAG TPA: hypothetical protein [Caudoviricetes sp.]